MALTDQSIIYRLYKQRQLDAPILSLALATQTLTLGSLNNDACEPNWHEYPVSVENQWIFHVKTVDVLNGSQYASGKVSYRKTSSRMTPLIE